MRLDKFSTLMVLSVATIFELVSVTGSAGAVALTGLANGNTLVFFDSAAPQLCNNNRCNWNQ